MMFESSVYSTSATLWEKRFKNLENQHRRTLDELNSVKTTASLLQTKVDQLQRHKEVANSLIDKEQLQVKISATELNEATCELYETKQKLHQEILKSNLERHRGDMAKEEIKQLQDEAIKYVSVQKNFVQLKKKNMEMMDDFKRTKSEVASKDMQNHILAEEVSRLREQCKALETEKSTISQELHAKTLKIKVTEASLEASRRQNTTLLEDRTIGKGVVEMNESLLHPKEKSTIHRELDSVKLRVVEAELRSVQCKLNIREQTIDGLRKEILDLKKQLHNKGDELRSSLSQNNTLNSFHDQTKEDLKLIEEKLISKTKQYKSLLEHNHDLSKRNEQLSSELNSLQHQLLTLQTDMLLQSKIEESDRREKYALERVKIEVEHQRLHSEHRCVRCHQIYTEFSNSLSSCCYHPGKYQRRQYPFAGHEWSCCKKKESTSSPCTFSGKHTDDLDLIERVLSKSILHDDALKQTDRFTQLRAASTLS